MYEKIIKDANFLLLILCVTGRVESVCYTNTDCTGSTIPAIDQADCCVRTNEGLAYLDDGGNCTVCTVHGFVKAHYDAVEGRSIEALFQLNVKGETAYRTLNTSRLSGSITAEAGGTSIDSDFEVFSYNDNETKIVVMATRDNITLEYDDTVILTFTPDDPSLISSLETAGEYIRDTATINIFDNDFLNLYFEEQYYHITEGSNLSQPIRMMFTKNQNPFNLTLRTIFSLEFLFYGSGALAIEGIDYTAEPIFIEFSAYYEDGVYELPEIFHVIDDDISERAESFAVISEIGQDIPTCYYPIDSCRGRSDATQIIIIDDDSTYTPPVIGFTQRSQTVLESDHENVTMELFSISVPVMTTKTFEHQQRIICRYQKDSSNAVVVSHPYFEFYFDVVFGRVTDPNGPLEEWLYLQPGEQLTEMQLTIRDDLQPESQECFTIVIMTVFYGVEVFTCNDSEDATNYFCSHTICIDDNDIPIEISLELTEYTLFENVNNMVEVCAIANRTVGSGETPFSVEIVLSVSLYVDFIGPTVGKKGDHLFCSYHTLGGIVCAYETFLTYNNFLLFSPLVDGLNKTCTNISIFLINDDMIAPPRRFSIMLDTYYMYEDRIHFPSEANATVYIEDGDMIVRFSSLIYTAFERDEHVQVCVDVQTFRGEILRPFAIVLLPGEGYETANDQYTLVCNVELRFTVDSETRMCYNYNITDDQVCELEDLTTIFQVQMGLLTSDSGIHIDPLQRVANITIDDTDELECFVEVYYTQNSYTLNETEGYVEICVEAKSLGISEEFYINAITTENQISLITNTSSRLSFSVNNTHPHDTQCYNISADYSINNLCDYCHIMIESQLMRGNERDRVTILNGSSTAEVVVELPESCMCLANPSSTSTISDGIIVAIVLSVLVVLAIIITIIVILVYRKKTKKLDVGIGLYEHHYFTLDESQKSSLLQHLQEQLTNKNMIFTKNQIQLSNTVGQGESGLVYKAYINTAIGKELVAVKTGKALFSTNDLQMLGKEVSTMLSFEHTNVMSLIGVCIDGEMPLLIMPFMSNGSVLDFIKRRKVEFLLTSKATQQEIQVAGNVLLGMCYQITKGMEYLSEHNFVHRDLAARNCMIDGNGVIKVADFGLTEDMYGTNYFRRRKSVTGSDEKVPIRWMAPESIENDIYNEATDVWSFGVTVWEIYTCGRIPYSGIHPIGLLRELQAGHRLDKPDNEACHDEIYDIMLSCWNIEGSDRPRFSSLVNTLSDLLERDSGYLQLSSESGCIQLELLQEEEKESGPVFQEQEMAEEPEQELKEENDTVC